MCGISGALSSESSKRVALADAVARMNAVHALRGPDDEGVWRDETHGVVFGHRRLSLIDLSPDGHQPMQRGALHITFNGEIYNYEEVKRELLAKGQTFRTRSDTEVILAAYEVWGPDCLSHFRGMFAFGIYNAHTGALFLARDRYGIKPLYYAETKESIVFASTVRAIEACGLVTLTKNPDADIGFLLFGSVPLPATTFKEVRSVRAGHYVEYRNGEMQEVRYYNALAPFLYPQHVSREDAVRAVRALLEESTRFHLVSDAPLGSFLSGGVDSSVLSILAARARKEPLTTVSIDFDERAFSERSYRTRVVKEIGSTHHEYVVRKEDFDAARADIIATMDQPTIDGVNTYFVSRKAKEARLTAVLSGLGSDELFMGYRYFRYVHLFRMIQRLPTMLKFSLVLFARVHPRFAKLIYLYKGRGMMHCYLALRGLFTPSEIAKILKRPEADVWAYIMALERELPSELETLHPANALSWLELNWYMANQLLKDTDIMSMRFSLETRVPFLDHVLVEYVSALPLSLKFGARPKELLIAAMGEDLPREAWDRPKMGFTFPLETWLREGNGGHESWARRWARVIKGART